MVQSNAATFTAPLDAAAILLMSFIPLLLAAALFIAWCRLFRRAGLPWERMFVPVYGAYWMYQIAGCGCLYWLNIAVFLLFAMLNGLIASQGVLTAFSIAYLAAVIVMHCLYCIRLAKAFGKGAGFAAGLILLCPVFMMILGFGRAEYQR